MRNDKEAMPAAKKCFVMELTAKTSGGRLNGVSTQRGAPSQKRA